MSRPSVGARATNSQAEHALAATDAQARACAAARVHQRSCAGGLALGLVLRATAKILRLMGLVLYITSQSCVRAEYCAVHV
eukprot:4799636-Pleurochrysis_carterae.AAC.3